MTVSDLIRCLKSYVDGDGLHMPIDRTAQVKIGKDINNSKDVWDYFDVICVNKKCIVLTPSDKWDRNKLK